MLKKMTIYFPSDESENYEQFDEFCENEEAKEDCRYIGYEIEIKGKFNTKTGEFFAHSLNNVELKQLVKI